MSRQILVTAALPYANGELHFGHLAGAYLPADIFVKYHRLKGSDVVYICGSDEHGVPITIAAQQACVSPQEIIDRFHPSIKRSFEEFGMEFDNYSRTSLPLHHRTAQDFFTNVYAKGLLDGKVLSSPVIREPILGGSGQISGSFTVEGANDLAILLRAGALPARCSSVRSAIASIAGWCSPSRRCRGSCGARACSST